MGQLTRGPDTSETKCQEIVLSNKVKRQSLLYCNKGKTFTKESSECKVTRF